MVQRLSGKRNSALRLQRSIRPFNSLGIQLLDTWLVDIVQSGDDADDDCQSNGDAGEEHQEERNVNSDG